MKLVDIDTIKPSSYNPRKADPRRLDLIELSFRKLGFVLPIYVDASGEILSGHQRHYVCQRIGVKQVPVSITKKMDLATRKAINIAFNRGTNDLEAKDTPGSITEVLNDFDVYGIAATLPDIDINSPEFYPCMASMTREIGPYLKANRGRWVTYARNLAVALGKKGIIMPVVATPDGKVINGIGRLQYLAERKHTAVKIVEISYEQAEFCNAMLNYLSMDFDIHNRYADVLRYNSFRRPLGKREYLGRASTFAIVGSKPSKTFDVHKPANANLWKSMYGTTVLDFGAGLMDETRILRQIGVDCVPFEPFVIGEKMKISPELSRKVVREFLQRVAEGTIFQTVFLSAIMNSVPFQQDRLHIVALLNALCQPNGKLYACSSSVKQAGYKVANGAGFLSKLDSKRLQFKLDYEPNTTLADITKAPKMQKYWTQKTFAALFYNGFHRVTTSESSNNVNAICEGPKPVDWTKLSAAIEFEFDLKYPNGETLGLIDEAKQAFSNRFTKHIT